MKIRGRVACLGLATGALLLAACGGDDGSASETTTGAPATTAASSTTGTPDAGDASTSTAAADVAVCTGTAWTDPADRSADRPLARCAAGEPAPVPLAEAADIVIGSAAPTSEHNGPVRFAVEKGEFAKENLTVEVRQISSADAMPLLANGDIDAIWGGPDAGFHNQIIAGANLKWVLGNYYLSPDSQAGLWANASCGSWDGTTPSLELLKNKTIGSLVGGGSTIIYPIGEAVKAAGGTLADVELKQLPGGADFISALRDCAVDAAWVLDPYWVELTGDANMVFLQGQPPQEPIGGLLFGPKLLDGDRAVGEALVRAWIRTINTYFPADYHEDVAFMQELAGILGQDANALLTTPSMQFDWEIRDGTSTREQDYYVQTGAQQVTLPEDQTTDRSYYEAVVGKGAEG